MAQTTKSIRNPDGAALALRVLLAAFLPGAAAAQTTWHVSSYADCPGSGTAADPFCTIDAALDAAQPGDTILVGPGEYHENIVIAKDGLTLRGAGAASTTIVGTPFAVVEAEGGVAEIPEFTLEGFHITTEDTSAAYIYGVWMNPANRAGSLWTVRACVIENMDIGIQLNDSWYDGAALIEDTVVTHCATGIWVYGENVTIRRCTVFDIAGVGIRSELPSVMEISDSIVAQTDAWAVQRYWGWPTTIANLLVHDTNLANPPAVPWAGPFMEHTAEGGGGGLWKAFMPLPGPVFATDPLFVDAAAGDVRPQAGSPAIDAGGKAPATTYDVLGFGHLRLDDGDFDGAAVVDLGAIEFGGLQGDSEVAGGATTSLDLWGKGGAFYGVALGVPGMPLDLGPAGTVFLSAAPLTVVASGVLPPAGTATVLTAIAPPAAIGTTVFFQAGTLGPAPGDALHLSNLESVTIVAP